MLFHSQHSRRRLCCRIPGSFHTIHAMPQLHLLCHDLSSNQTDPFQLSLYCVDTTPTLSSLCDKADLALFDNIITSSTHPLHSLLPPKVEKHYSTRPRGHCYQLPRNLTKAISFIVYYIVTFYRLLLLIYISISDV